MKTTTTYFIRLKGAADQRFAPNKLTYGVKECREHIAFLRKHRDPDSRRRAYAKAAFEIVREEIIQTVVSTDQPAAGKPTVRCSCIVRYPGLNFPRYHQCTRTATTVNDEGKPVCTQHSPAAVAAREVKRELANQRAHNSYMARIRAKNNADRERKNG